MHYTDVAFLLNSHCCTFEFYSAIFMLCTVLLLIINNHYRPFSLDSSLFMYSRDLEPFLHRCLFKFGLYSSVFMHCIDPPLTLNSHYCASEFFCFHAFYRSCSSSQQSLLHIQARFYSFMHFTDLPLTLSSHYCAFGNFCSDVFIHWTNFAIIASSYQC